MGRSWLSVLCGVAVLASACSSGINYTGGLRPTPPSPRQEVAIEEYSSQSVALNLAAGDRDPNNKVGCGFSPMATKSLTGKSVIAYGQVLCETCPPAATGAVLPVVARVDGNVVLSERAAYGLSGSNFQTEIQKIFPKALWAEAAAQNLPDANALLRAAHEEAGCS